MSNIIITGNNLSNVWLEVFSTLYLNPPHEISPLIVQINVSNETNEIKGVREKLDAFLNKGEDCHTVANTIFPISLWNKNLERNILFERYKKIWPQIKRFRPNYHGSYLPNNKGTYFQRMIDYNSLKDTEPFNQLEHIITTWNNGNHLRSALQASIFDPRTDHNHSRRREFPCLQQLAFNPLGKNGCNGLEIIAFYANQTIVEKAYGNYLGLLNLGKFMAHEMKLNLAKITCVSCVAKLSSDQNKNIKSLAKTLGI